MKCKALPLSDDLLALSIGREEAEHHGDLAVLLSMLGRGAGTLDVNLMNSRQ